MFQKHFYNTRGVNCIRTINQKRYLLITTNFEDATSKPRSSTVAHRLGTKKKNSDPIRSVLTSFLLDDYTQANGTTRVVPGSHKFLKTPAEAGYYYQDHPEQKYIEARKGSLLIYDINLWHCGTKNLNGQKRRHLNINYRDRKIWQQINFKKDLKENYKKRLNKAESYLLKIREEDVDRNEWLFKNRNNFFIKKMMNFYWNYN